MAFLVTAYKDGSINLAPENTTEEVLQNVAMILATPKFTVPLDRGFGLSQHFVDKPLPVAKTVLIGEIMEGIAKFEPRAEVEAVTFQINEQIPGKLIPTVEVRINGG